MTDEVQAVARQMFDLFAGRTDAWGSDTGGCVKEPLQLRHFVEHLLGTRGIGVYPLMDGNHVWWGCVDFDEGDEPSWVHARNVQMVAEKLGLVTWIERSRSKGYHVWCFAEEPVHAVDMRLALAACCQIAKAPTKEVNPKQTDTTLLAGGYGNYVRLPYKGWFDSAYQDYPTRQVVVDSAGDPIPPGEFVRAAYVDQCARHDIERVAALYQRPARFVPPPAPSHMEGDAIKRMSGLAYTIWKDGPLSDETGHMDRSGALFKLAVTLRSDGRHSFDEALVLVRDLDARLGKFCERADGEQRLYETVAKAWGR